jgi:hypothetical protein
MARHNRRKSDYFDVLKNPGTKRKLMISKTKRGYSFSYRELVEELPAGIFIPEFDDHLEEFVLKFAQHNLEEDKLHCDFVEQKYFSIENYVPPFDYLKKCINNFFNSKEFYTSNKLDFKRSILICGDPGTGKTRFIANIADELIQKYDALVIRIESNEAMATLLEGTHSLADFCKNRLKVIVIEELYELINTSNKSGLLNMLDSTFLKDNVLFLMTTNFPQKIPVNMIDRPSRIDDIVPVYKEDFSKDFIINWYQHIMGSPFPQEDIDSGLLNELNGKYTLAYLKEIFLKSLIHSLTLSESYNQIKRRRAMIERQFSRNGEIGF